MILYDEFNCNIYIYIHILYLIAEAERKLVPTIKEVVTNRKKHLFKN